MLTFQSTELVEPLYAKTTPKPRAGASPRIKYATRWAVSSTSGNDPIMAGTCDPLTNDYIVGWRLMIGCVSFLGAHKDEKELFIQDMPLELQW